MDSAPPAITTRSPPGDGLKAGGTEAIDGDAGDFNGEAGAQGGPASDVPALLAFGLGATEDDVVDFGAIEGGDPVQGSGQGNSG